MDIGILLGFPFFHVLWIRKTQQLAIPDTRRARQWKAAQGFLPPEMAPPRPDHN